MSVFRATIALMEPVEDAYLTKYLMSTIVLARPNAQLTKPMMFWRRSVYQLASKTRNLLAKFAYVRKAIRELMDNARGAPLIRGMMKLIKFANLAASQTKPTITLKNYADQSAHPTKPTQ